MDMIKIRVKQKNWKTEKTEKKITEKIEPWKKLIKLIKILKKPTDSVQFWFYKPEIEKTKPNTDWKKIRKKPSQTGWTCFFPKKDNQTETSRFESVSFF